MKQEGLNFNEKLNELMKTDLICLGYKGEQAYYTSKKNIKPKEYSGLALEPISDIELSKKLKKFGSSHKKTFIKEFEYQTFEAKDKIRQKKLMERQKLNAEIEKVIFPCAQTDVELNNHTLIGSWQLYKTKYENGEERFEKEKSRPTLSFGADYTYKQFFPKADFITAGNWRVAGNQIITTENKFEPAQKNAITARTSRFSNVSLNEDTLIMDAKLELIGLAYYLRIKIQPTNIEH
jgi:hypothetical protein